MEQQVDDLDIYWDEEGVGEQPIFIDLPVRLGELAQDLHIAPFKSKPTLNNVRQTLRGLQGNTRAVIFACLGLKARVVWTTPVAPPFEREEMKDHLEKELMVIPSKLHSYEQRRFHTFERRGSVSLFNPTSSLIQLCEGSDVDPGGAALLRWAWNFRVSSSPEKSQHLLPKLDAIDDLISTHIGFPFHHSRDEWNESTFNFSLSEIGSQQLDAFVEAVEYIRELKRRDPRLKVTKHSSDLIECLDWVLPGSEESQYRKKTIRHILHRCTLKANPERPSFENVAHLFQILPEQVEICVRRFFKAAEAQANEQAA